MEKPVAKTVAVNGSDAADDNEYEMLRICPYCNKKHSKNHKVCSQCGSSDLQKFVAEKTESRMIKVKVCAKCKSLHSSEYEQCQHCGSFLHYEMREKRNLNLDYEYDEYQANERGFEIPKGYYRLAVKDSHVVRELTMMQKIFFDTDTDYLPTNGSGRYKQGAVAAISAGIRRGYIFSNWEAAEPDVTIHNAHNANATLTMPSKDVTVSAKWLPISRIGEMKIKVKLCKRCKEVYVEKHDICLKCGGKDFEEFLHGEIAQRGQKAVRICPACKEVYSTKHKLCRYCYYYGDVRLI
ncbi:MAG: hypothetical protein FWG42_08685 [Clostridiales bacterium]|nr:hypothetical protein [Clostridiales bacterium]